jgi:hypothetical protein
MKSISIFVLLLFIWPFSGAKTYKLTASSKVPAASGTVKVQTGHHNHNTNVDVKVYDLARPTNLPSSSNVYVLWIQPNGRKPANEGQLKVNKKLNGELHAQTTAKNFKLFITPEQGPTVSSPHGDEVLHTHITLK